MKTFSIMSISMAIFSPDETQHNNKKVDTEQGGGADIRISGHSSKRTFIY